MVLTESLSAWLRQSFARLVTEQTGLEIRAEEQVSFSTKILARTKALKLPFPEAYYQLLESKTTESLQEWQNLVVLLTNPESFFLRDKSQFNLLKNYIIPELLVRKQNSKTIRVCSAGCSTGEEAYSLAILFKELIPDLTEWNLTILGVDINPVSLKQAKAGIYRSWSFRGVDTSIQQQYFRQIHDRYQIHPQIQQMLEFEVLNLVKDPFPHPASKLKDMDLILCRNVFIYFEQSAIAHVLNKIYHALQPLGYLITGHTELHAQELLRFQTRVFSEALFYQRPDLTLNQLPSASSLNVEPLLPAKNTKPVEREKNTDVRLEQFRLKNQSSTAESIKTQKFPEPTESQLIQRTESLLKKKAYNLALQQLEKALELNSRNPYAHHLMAQILTELDEFTEAIHCCQQAIDLAQSPTAHYYLLAGIFEQQGNIKQAEQILREIIYLEPGSIVASIKLSRIYQQAGYQQQAVSMQELSFATLKQLPADKRIPELNNLTVAELMSELESAGSSGLPVKE